MFVTEVWYLQYYYETPLKQQAHKQSQDRACKQLSKAIREKKKPIPKTLLRIIGVERVG
jgi:hypothetical protein